VAVTLAGWAARWLLFGGLLTAVGAVTVRGLLLPREADRGARARAARTLAGAGAWGAGAVLAGLAALFAVQLAEFRDPFAPLTEDVTLLLGSAWGGAWKAGGAAAVVALVAFLGARGVGRGPLRTGAWFLAAAASCHACFYPAFTGHAMSGPRPWSWLADGVHVLAAGAWLGSLPLLLLVVRRRLREGERGGEVAGLLTAFAPVALSAAALLTATGVFASWTLLPGPGALVDTRYGRTLLLKLALVGAVAVLGSVNWRRSVPRLRDTGQARGFRRVALAEWLASHAVLAVTAWLVHTPPPAGG
jgi:putative copper export protein